MSSDATIVTGRRVADRYRLVEPRPDGSWDAVDETLRRSVVVHLLKPSAPSEAKAHFTAEARTLARLNHLNIVATYDTGVDGDGASYRVDALAGGAPLNLDAVDDAHRMSFAIQIARALTDAHAIGLVHGALNSTSALVDDEGRLQVRGLRLPAPTEDVLAVQHEDVKALTDVVVGLAPATASPLRDIALGWRTAPPASVAAMLDALESAPSAEAIVEPPPPPLPTPATGVPTVRRRSRPALIVAVSAVALAAVAAAIVLPGRGGGGAIDGDARPLGVTASSFDPEGDKSENENLVRLLIDGIASTEWKTDLYRRANFGNLKSGVGLVLRVQAGAAELSDLTITSPSRGWAVEVFVTDQPAAALSGWGRPIAGATVTGESTVIPLNGAKGAAVLVWIADPGANRQVRIEELALRGRL